MGQEGTGKMFSPNEWKAQKGKMVTKVTAPKNPASHKRNLKCP